MSAMSNSDFAKRMMLLARPAEQFEPTALYDPDGDCIEFLAKPYTQDALAVKVRQVLDRAAS